jgi:hypothetical protein
MGKWAKKKTYVIQKGHFFCLGIQQPFPPCYVDHEHGQNIVEEHFKDNWGVHITHLGQVSDETFLLGIWFHAINRGWFFHFFNVEFDDSSKCIFCLEWQFSNLWTFKYNDYVS